MNPTPVKEESSEDSNGDEPVVPEGVLRGIEDIEEGNTASKDDIESLLKF